jgi:hypothetical protein
MKKILTIIFLAAFTLSVSAQSIFKPVPGTLFKQDASSLKSLTNASTWLWRFSAMVTATELQYDKATKQFVSAPLSSVGPAIGYRHFTALPDGTPFNDWGINAAILLGTDLEHIDPARIKAALLINAFSFVNVGACYTFGGTNHFGILLGASISF